MKKTAPDKQTLRFNLYLTRVQYDQVSRLQAVGLSASTIARQAIRKCHTAELLAEDDTPRPERVNPYLSNEDALMLQRVADRDGCSKAQSLRRLVSTYLAKNASSIDALF
jgi:hypothetical protein